MRSVWSKDRVMKYCLVRRLTWSRDSIMLVSERGKNSIYEMCIIFVSVGADSSVCKICVRDEIYHSYYNSNLFIRKYTPSHTFCTICSTWLWLHKWCSLWHWGHQKQEPNAAKMCLRMYNLQLSDHLKSSVKVESESKPFMHHNVQNRAP